MTDSIAAITKQIRAFADARGWGKALANPKDLSLSIVLEAGELMEIFQWVPDERLRARLEERRQDVEDEAADVAIYLLQFADHMNIDLAKAIEKKMEKNGEKYPVK